MAAGQLEGPVKSKRMWLDVSFALTAVLRESSFRSAAARPCALPCPWRGGPAARRPPAVLVVLQGLLLLCRGARRWILVPQGRALRCSLRVGGLLGSVHQDGSFAYVCRSALCMSCRNRMRPRAVISSGNPPTFGRYSMHMDILIKGKKLNLLCRVMWIHSNLLIIKKKKLIKLIKFFWKSENI